MKKKIKWFLIGIVVLFLVVKAPLISYLIMQGQGQFRVLWHARPVVEVLEEGENGELKEKLRLVKEIKTYTRKELGLASDGLYTTIYDQEGKDILWNLTACEPFAIKSLEWSFPIVGSVSYKGFFDLEKAKYEEVLLIEKGFDTRIRAVNAWSTLGWFSDPILSNTLNRSEGRIAELFIHEITHANIFIKDSLSFNENLASFIGEEGALRFLTYKHGENHELMNDYIQSEADSKLFVDHCLRGIRELKNLYAAFGQDMNTHEKVKKKEMYMAEWVNELHALPFHNQAYGERFNDELPNNAFFTAFERYASKKHVFAKQLNEEFGGDLKSFIAYYIENSDRH